MTDHPEQKPVVLLKPSGLFKPSANVMRGVPSPMFKAPPSRAPTGPVLRPSYSGSLPGTSPTDAPHTPHTPESGGSPVMSPRTDDPPSSEHSPRPSSDEISMTPPGSHSNGHLVGRPGAPKGLNFGRFPNAPPPSAPAIGPSDSPPTGTPDTNVHLGKVLLSPHNLDNGRPLSIGPRQAPSSPAETRLRGSPQARGALESPGRSSGRGGSFSAYDTTPRPAGPSAGATAAGLVPASGSSGNNAAPGKAQVQRTHVVAEIVKTEKDYVEDLMIMTEMLVVPMQQQQILTQKDMTVLFSPVFESIKGVNIAFLSALHKAVPTTEGDLSDACVADAFLKMADFFKIYSGYFTNQPTALSILQKHEAENPAFMKFVDATMQHPKMRGLKLFAFLIKPCQRLLKYPLLLRELVKCTSEDHPDRERLVLALKKFEEIATQMNEAKREAEIRQKIFDLQENLRPEGGVDMPQFFDQKRQLLLDDTLNLVQKGKLHKRRVVLFDDMLLVIRQEERSTIMKLLANLPLGQVKVTNVADPEGSTFRHQFCVARTGDAEGWTFSCEDEKKKQEWLTEVRAIVKEHQREAALAMRANQGTSGAAPGAVLKPGGGGGAGGGGGSPMPGRRNP